MTLSFQLVEQNANEILSVLKERKRIIVFIDVNQEDFFASHHIPGAENVPYRAQIAGSSKNIFLQGVSKVLGSPESEKRHIIVYSDTAGNKVGQMAQRALLEQGYTHVTHMSDGLRGWILADGPIAPDQVTLVPETKLIASDLDACTQEFVKNGFLLLPNIDPELVEKAGSAFAKLATLSPEVIAKFARPKSATPNCMHSDIGGRTYKLTELGVSQEMIVWSPKFDELFAEEISDYPEAQMFIKAARNLNTCVKIALEEMFEKMSGTFPGIREAFFPESREPLFSMWFIKYPYVEVGENGLMNVCRPHSDFGPFVLILGENPAGFRIGDVHADDFEFPQRRPDQVLVNPGLDFFRVTPGINPVTPVWHDVACDPEKGYSTEIARWSIAFFVEQQKSYPCSVCGDVHSVLY